MSTHDSLFLISFPEWQREQAEKAGRCHAAITKLVSEFGIDLVNDQLDIHNRDEQGLLSVRELADHALRVSSRGALTPADMGHASMTHTARLGAIRQHIDSIEHARQHEADARDEAVEQLRARKVA